jgi:hypothetical protein
MRSGLSNETLSIPTMDSISFLTSVSMYVVSPFLIFNKDTKYKNGIESGSASAFTIFLPPIRTYSPPAYKNILHARICCSGPMKEHISNQEVGDVNMKNVTEENQIVTCAYAAGYPF